MCQGLWSRVNRFERQISQNTGPGRSAEERHLEMPKQRRELKHMGYVKTNDTAAPTLQEIPLFEKYKDNVLFSEQYSQKNGFETRQKKFAKQCRKGQKKEENIPGLISAARQSHRIIVVKTAYDVSARVRSHAITSHDATQPGSGLTHSLAPALCLSCR